MTINDGLQTAAMIWLWIEIVGAGLGLVFLIVVGRWALKSGQTPEWCPMSKTKSELDSGTIPECYLCEVPMSWALHGWVCLACYRNIDHLPQGHAWIAIYRSRIRDGLEDVS